MPGDGWDRPLLQIRRKARAGSGTPVPTLLFPSKPGTLADVVEAAGGSQGVTPCFQLLQLMRRSCGIFNPFLLSLFPWSCCCSDGHSVCVAGAGDSGPQALLGSGAAEPRRPLRHGDAQVQEGWEAGNEVSLSCPAPGPAVGEGISMFPLCPVRFPWADAGAGGSTPEGPLFSPCLSMEMAWEPPPAICILPFC